MQLKHFLPILIFIPFAVIQLTIIPFVSIGHISPDLIVIIVVYFTLLYGQIYGTLLGFTLGFLFDLLSGGLIGSAMFAKTLAGFSAGYFYNENKIDQNTKSITFVVIIFVCAVIDSLAYSVLAYSGTGMDVLYLMFELSILPGVYTTLVVFPILIFMTKKV